MISNTVCANPVLSTNDLKLRSEQDLCEIIGRFLITSEGVLAHWVEYARGVLLFITAPDDDRSGEFYVYDRKKGTFWLLELVDGIFGGYPVTQMRQKIREFRFWSLPRTPAGWRLPPVSESRLEICRRRCKGILWRMC